MKPTLPIPPFIPTTQNEVRDLGWSALDVILITGDTYIDASYMGIAVIGKVLLSAGYRVGIIAQPDTDSDRDIGRLGEPELFWGVSGGCVDSMIANYTASGKKRKEDDMTPGRFNGKRPDRALIIYSNLIRRYFKHTKPIVLGGIEASLRRISHYDFKSDAVRRSILFDTRADILVYGMGEETVLQLAERLREKEEISNLRGICYISSDITEKGFSGDDSSVLLPPHTLVSKDKVAFSRMFSLFYENSDPITGKRLLQLQDTRYLVQNPPPMPPSPEFLDWVHELPYARDVHPFYSQMGEVRALSTFRFSITTHRGCYGECRFCAIAVHQGRHVISRSKDSILNEVKKITAHPDFKGHIADVGGPTANMYGFECSYKKENGACTKRGCIHPSICKNLPVSHASQIEILREIREMKGVRKVFVSSGIRYDLILNDTKYGKEYLKELIRNHVSGQLKIAPEHCEDEVLRLMGKPFNENLLRFMDLFQKENKQNPKKVFLTYYMMAAHPGCTLVHMQKLKSFASRTLKLIPEQTQIFTPSPSTYSTLMYHTGFDPFTNRKVFVEKETVMKELQKNTLIGRRNHPGKKGKGKDGKTAPTHLKNA